CEGAQLERRLPEAAGAQQVCEPIAEGSAVAAEHLVAALAVEHHGEPGSPCACTIAGRSSTSGCAVNVTQCGSAPVRSTTAWAKGRSSKPRSPKYAVTVFWCSWPCAATATAIDEESIPPERHVPTGTSLRSCNRTASRNVSRTAATGSFGARDGSSDQ